MTRPDDTCEQPADAELGREAWDAVGVRVPRIAARFAAVVKSVQLAAAESGGSTRESMGSS